MEAVQKQTLIEWCDQQVKDGKELALCWEGGGDSGWVYFELDGDQTENEHTNTLVDMMYDVLDYGSWAGEFSADGRAIYNAETKCFEGTDHYSEDDSVEYPCNIKIEVPENVWFDTLEYNIEEETVTGVVLSVKNGFVTDMHTTVAEKIKNSLQEKLSEVIREFNNDPEHDEFRSIWSDELIERADFEKKDDKLVFTITSISIGVYQYDDKDVCLDLNQFLNTKTQDNED